MSDIFSSPSDMQALTALDHGDIGHDDSMNVFDHQPPFYQSFGSFGSDSLAPLPYTFNANDDETATFTSGANLGHVDMPLDPPNTLSTLDSSSQTFQHEEMMPTSYVSNDGAASVVTQSNILRIWATEHDWTRHRTLITQLYEENKLPKVMSIMESQEGFKATVKMYKTHIAKWRLDKKNKEPEMRAIVRKNKQRADQGKRSNFLIRKRQLNLAEVDRYWQRKGLTIDEVIARSIASPTPEAVECFTPVSSPITPPADLATPEYILRIIRGYIVASFESGTWVKTDPRSGCYSIKGGKEAKHSTQKFGDSCRLAVRLFSRQNIDEAEKALSAAFAISRKMLVAEQPDILPVVLRRIISMQRRQKHEIALRILRKLSAISEELLGESHPLCLLCASLAAMPWSQIGDIISRCFDVMINDLESILGTMHLSTLNIRLFNDIDINLAMLQRLLDKCESALGSYDVRTLDVRKGLMRCTFNKGHYAEAKRMGEDLLACVRRNKERVQPGHFNVVSHRIIALCQYALCEPHSAIQNLEVAVHLRTKEFGAQDGMVRNLYLYLEQWYLEQGQLYAATTVRDRRGSLWNQQKQYNRTYVSGWDIPEWSV